MVPRLSAGGWGILGQGQGTPGVLPEGHAQPWLWGHAAAGEAVVLGLELELAVAAGQRLVRLALCLPQGGNRGGLGDLPLATGLLSQSHPRIPHKVGYP